MSLINSSVLRWVLRQIQLCLKLFFQLSVLFEWLNLDQFNVYSFLTRVVLALVVDQFKSEPHCKSVAGLLQTLPRQVRLFHVFIVEKEVKTTFEVFWRIWNDEAIVWSGHEKLQVPCLFLTLILSESFRYKSIAFNVKLFIWRFHWRRLLYSISIGSKPLF